MSWNGISSFWHGQRKSRPGAPLFQLFLCLQKSLLIAVCLFDALGNNPCTEISCDAWSITADPLRSLRAGGDGGGRNRNKGNSLCGVRGGVKQANAGRRHTARTPRGRWQV